MNKISVLLCSVSVISLNVLIFILFSNPNQSQLSIIYNFTDNINSKLLHPIFDFMHHILLLINNCVMVYFIVFQNLFHFSLYIILESVLQYFHVFHSLFIYSLDTLRFILHDYFDLIRLSIQYLLYWPTSFATFFTINCILYLKFK